MIRQCSACGSKRLVRGHMAAETWGWPTGFYVPTATGFLRKPTSSLRAIACADCGNVQVVASSVEALNRLYHEQHRDSLPALTE
jgi:hypothetical protein